MTSNQGLMDTVKTERKQDVGSGQSPGNETAKLLSTQNENGGALVAQKRVIWISGGKGGTGKSTFARGLAHTLQVAGTNLALFDGDPENAQLYRYYKQTDDGVARIAIKQRNGVDSIITEMDDVGTQVILVDAPAGGNSVLAELEEENGFLSGMAEGGYSLTMVTVLSRIRDSINQLKWAMDLTDGYDVAHVAVKNLFYGDAHKFRFLDRSKTKQRLLDNGGHVIEMRDLFEDTYELLDEFDFSFQAAITADRKQFPSPDVRRVKQWTKHFKQQVMATGGVLGL